MIFFITQKQKKCLFCDEANVNFIEKYFKLLLKKYEYISIQANIYVKIKNQPVVLLRQ